MALSTAGWNIPPPRIVSITCPLLKKRENQRFVNMTSDAVISSCYPVDNLPPNVHLFILDTLEGPAKGRKWELGSIVHICYQRDSFTIVPHTIGSSTTELWLQTAVSHSPTQSHLLVTMPRLRFGLSSSSLSVAFSLPFLHDNSRSGSFKAFNKIGRPRTSNRLARNLIRALEPSPIVDRVKAEPSVLPIPSVLR